MKKSNLKPILECECDIKGSNSTSCDSNGMCTCKPKFTGSKCTECDSGFFGFPECKGKNLRVNIH